MIACEKLSDTNFKIPTDFPLHIANFMVDLNNSEIPEIGNWSMRNIRKLHRRIVKQQMEENSSYYNITIEHQIVFLAQCRVELIKN